MPTKGIRLVEVKGEQPTLSEFEMASRWAKDLPGEVVVIAWEHPDELSGRDRVAFWHDKNGVLHSKHGASPSGKRRG